MSTMVAYRYLGETGTFGKKRKDSVDTLSAEIILQSYLDRERAQASESNMF
jgi:RNase H-fold protein (predicted Holliday junction resolvase)